MNATAITANVRKLIMRFSTLGHDSIGWRGFCDELNDFRPSRAWSHHCGLGVRDLALGCWNNSWVSNLFSFTRVQEPRLAKPAPVPLQLGVPTISGLSSPPSWGRFCGHKSSRRFALVILDTPAAEFRLPATDGKTYALDDVAGEKGTVVVFICNHCPYVKAVIDRMVADARVLMSEGVGFAAICSNDAASYPEDSFENMKRFAKAHDFPFPYLHDETQTVARAYGAVCTPDFFGYNANRKLKYRGRLDEGRTTPPRAGALRELVEAMRAIAATGVAPADQKASIGCSIKWKDA